MNWYRGLALSSLALGSLVPRYASANDRHFTYTYESAVLPEGGRELEIWTTPRIGRDNFYARFDQRMEFEIGLTDNLMTSFYVNTTSVTAEDDSGVRSSDFEFSGVSSEWKYKLLDPVADAVGLSLYGELTGGASEFELEAKLIVDKRIGDVLFAGNLVLEQEWEFEGDETIREFVLEADLAATYFLAPTLAVGFEVRNHNEFPEGEGWEHSALYAGPVLAYAREGWWVALSVMPQLPAPKTAEHQHGSSVLDEHEKINARLLFSFHL